MTTEVELLDSLAKELFPLLRSITGPGLEASIDIFRRHMPLEIEKVPSGTHVFDWKVPREWHLKSARLTGPNGETIADVHDSNLHIVSYSAPVDRKLSLDELQHHLHSLPNLPNAIPYVTSYYNESWGFCIADEVRRRLKSGTYHAFIESEFVDGGVPFAHCVLDGETTQEILLSSYLCHPSLGNNELSGPLALLGLFRRISAWSRRRYTYRFLINPETIGALCFLSRYAKHLHAKMVGGLVLTCLGGPTKSLSYKQSRRSDGLIDQVFSALKEHGGAHGPLIEIRPFDPTSGSDERQYCSPGFNLPVGQIARTVYGQYPGYHNSLDDLAFMDVESVCRSVDGIEEILKNVEIGGRFVNQKPFGEPQLGRRGLYPSINSSHTWVCSTDHLADNRTVLNRILTILNYTDGHHDMIEIAQICDCPLLHLAPAVEVLEENGLLKFMPSHTE